MCINAFSSSLLEPTNATTMLKTTIRKELRMSAVLTDECIPPKKAGGLILVKSKVTQTGAASAMVGVM